MCALLLGNPFGEIRGRLGGSIFSRNGHGQYIRNYSVGVNPNTVAQQTARNSFSTIVNLYQNLDSDDISLWNEYAKTQFVPRTRSHSMKYSGYQAFMSLKMANYRAQFFNRNYEASFVDYSGLVSGYRSSWVSYYSEPPLKNKQANAVDKFGNIQSMYLDSCSMAATSRVTFRIRLGNDIVLPKWTSFLDSNGNQNGFVIFASNPVRMKGYFIKNPLFICLGHLKPWYISPGDEAVHEGKVLEYNTLGFIDKTKYKSFYTAGDWVQLTIYTIDLYGQMKRVGSETILVAST